MALIDPEGLYFGDRMARLSLMARLHWPYLFLLCDAFGRFEINYAKVLSRAYQTFTPQPNEDELRQYLREYRDAFLLFIWRVDGVWWGQWETSEKFLPKYKDARSLRSPQPPSVRIDEWRNKYLIEKHKSNDCSLSKTFPECLETFPLGKGVGKGLGNGNGIGKNSSSPAAPDEGKTQRSGTTSNEPRKGESRKSPALASLAEQQATWFDSEFWPEYWRKVDKADALKAFKKHATCESKKNEIVQAVIAHAPNYLRRDPEHRPHAATWLNKHRYLEPPEETTPIRTGRSVMEGV